MNTNLPNDPVILVSYLNTQLRDFYSSLDELCKAFDIKKDAVEQKLAAIDYQGRHIGLELISRTLDYIQKDVMEGETVMVSLMAAYQRESFYEKFGFHKRPFGNHGSGMSVWMSRNASGEITNY